MLFNHHVGPILIISPIKKGYTSISRACVVVLEKTGEGELVGLNWDDLYSVI